MLIIVKLVEVWALVVVVAVLVCPIVFAILDERG